MYYTRTIGVDRGGLRLFDTLSVSRFYMIEIYRRIQLFSDGIINYEYNFREIFNSPLGVILYH